MRGKLFAAGVPSGTLLR